MAAIKFHAPIDTRIFRNHIYRTARGIWLDWMSQGTWVARNLLHDNGPYEDLFVEVNHGPFLVEHNLLLSPIALFDMSQGGAYVHNLFAGRIATHSELNRETPYHAAHATRIAGLQKILGGDNRFYNNIFVGFDGLAPYGKPALPMQMGGNVFLKGASAAHGEKGPLVRPGVDPGLRLAEAEDGLTLHVVLDTAWAKERCRPLVTSALLGKAIIPDLPYEQPDGSPHRIATDWFARERNTGNPFPGPFALPAAGKAALAVWPIPDHR
jgi:alpha-N-arabinofuranosidase